MPDSTPIVFSPEGISTEDYKKKYPELDTIQEFKTLKTKELIFVWYYSNPTSYMIYQYPEKKDRALQAWSKAMGTAMQGQNFAEQFLDRRLPNQTKIEEAIRRMEKILPTVRFQAMEMVNKVFNDFKDLLDTPKSEFAKADGSVDYNSYMALRKNVLKELEEMVKLREIGFGISNRDETKIEGQKIIENYLKGKHKV